ncbi:MAG: FtsQ-type POTRA domain-containing protein [Desulfobacterales bacterium]|nr:FtsQ-type POTRA domain-containing protein [Desulfobacterales bacterium]
MEPRKRKRKNRLKVHLDQRRQLQRQRLGQVFRVLAGLILVPILGLGLIFGHDLLTQCRFFQIARIDVIGGEHLTQIQLCRQAEVAPGMNLLSINLEHARKRLLAHPWVADAAVRREFPDRLRIWVQEHHPLAVLEFDRPLLLDTAGQVFKVAEPTETQGLPRITGLGYGDVPVGKDDASPAFTAALSLLQAGDTGFSGAIDRIRVDPETGLTLWTDTTGGAVVVGYGDYVKKFNRFSQVLAHLERHLPGQRMERINLTDINRVVVAPKRDEPTAAGPKEV